MLNAQHASSTGLHLDDSLRLLKGVGPQAATALEKLNLRTVGDLLRHIPRRWEDRTDFRRVADVQGGEYVTVCGIVIAASTTYPKPKLAITKVLIDDNGAALTLTWFNQTFMERTFNALKLSRKPVVVYGQARRAGWTVEIANPEWEELGEDSDVLSANRVVPVYPATEGVRQGRLRKMVWEVLQAYSAVVDETLPSEVIRRHGLVAAAFAARNIHFPESLDDLIAARRRLIFEEFFLLQVLLAARRRANSHETQGIRFTVSPEKLNADMAQIVPFQLTNAQQRSIREIACDVTSGHAMNRLLQGDVGSGKTMVALASLLMAVENGYQAALMAPTEILAQQHAIVLRRYLEPLGIAVELSIGSQTAREKRESRERLLGGQSRIAVGTHALIQERRRFCQAGSDRDR